MLRLLVICALVACAPRAPTSPVAPASLSSAIVWSRRSAEHDAVFVQTFRLASERLTELAAGQARGKWAVILDADETVLDNSVFEERRALKGTAYSEAIWEDYVREEIAAVLPGALDFVRHVRALGGRIAIVSNRSAAVCDATRRNLTRLDLHADVVLCRGDSDDKNARFRSVQEGSAARGLPALSVLMWLGDNIEDFPGLSQKLSPLPANALSEFGRSYIVLPNPMYGSWQ
jgi:5'-nucleotidase (lipoprotein e(P4) family)